jgi:hypothetical protein
MHRCRSIFAAIWRLAVLLGAAAGALGHEVPGNVMVTVFVKPEGDTLRVLVRAPLGAMRDMDFPLQGPGYLDIAAAEDSIRDAAMLWLGDQMTFFEDGRPLDPGRIAAARVSLPSSDAFTSYPAALAHVRAAPLPRNIELYWEQGLLDVLFEYDITSAGAELAMDATFAHLGLRTVTLLQFLPEDAPARVFRYLGDPGRVALDPRWHHAAGQFVTQGFHHVLGGLDHLLFVVCLVIPFRRLKPLVVLVTAFTVAHSLTLTAAALGLAPDAGWFPPLVETLIAGSIVYLALENLLAPNLERRWLLAFAFGLVHGFGFAFVLADHLQFAGSHLAVSLAAFNVGIELGQLFVVAVALAALAGLFRLGLPQRFGIAVLSVAVAHTAWHWMLERGSALLAHPFAWPVLTLDWWAAAARWLMLLLVAVAALWLLHLAYQRWMGAEPASPEL